MEFLGTTIAAILTLCIFSFLYKDNPAYKIAQHLFLGVSLGYALVVKVIKEGIYGTIADPLIEAMHAMNFMGVLSVLIATTLGLLFFYQFVPDKAWVVRIPLALTIGYGAGIAMYSQMDSIIFPQISSTVSEFNNFFEKPLFVDPDKGRSMFNTVLMFIGVLSTLTYFFFSAEHRGVVGGISKIGIIFIMVSFGAAFGNAVMGRISLLIGRISFLLGDWLHLI